MSVQAVLVLLLLSVTMVPVALATAPDDIKQRIQLLDTYKQNNLISKPPGGGEKAWTQAEKNIFWRYLDMIYDHAPGLVERAVLYRPIRVYRAADPKFQKLMTLPTTQELVLADWWFRPRAEKTAKERDILTMQPLAHEMFHLAEPFASVSYSKAWQAAVGPRMQKVRDHFKANGMSVLEARATSKRSDEYDHISHAQGLPNIFAAHAMYEALAESGATMLFQKHIEIAPDMQEVLKANFVERPKKKDAAKVLAHEALSAWEKGDPKKAVELFSEAEKSGANWGKFYSYRARIWLANMFLLKNAGPNALSDRTKAIEIMAFDAPSDLLDRAYLWKVAGQLDLAVQDYTAYLDVHVFNAQVVNNRAKLYQRLGDLQHALKDYDLLIKREAKSSAAYGTYLAGRSKIELALKQLDVTLADLSQKISLSPPENLHQLYFRRGAIWARKNDTDKAIADYSKAIELKAGFFGAYISRGVLFIRLLRFDEATRDLEASHKLMPLDLATIITLAKLVRRQGDAARADALMGSARKIDPDRTKKLEPHLRFGLGL